MLVVDLTRYLPGAFASRELLRLGARVVRLESPDGDPMRQVAPAWDEALNGGKESVACDLKTDPELAQALLPARTSCSRASGPAWPRGSASARTTCPSRSSTARSPASATEGPHAARAGHDLNYLGWAGVLEDTAPGVPPVQPADLAAGALGAVVEMLAAVLERERTGRGARLTISMTHGSHRLVAHRVGGDPLPRFLTGGVACYRIYATADRRPADRRRARAEVLPRLCEVIDRPELGARQFDAEGRRSSPQSSGPTSPRGRSTSGWSSSTARTSAWARCHARRGRRGVRRRNRPAVRFGRAAYVRMAGELGLS